MPKEFKLEEKKEAVTEHPLSTLEYQFQTSHKDRRKSYIFHEGQSYDSPEDKIFRLPAYTSVRFFYGIKDRRPSYTVKATGGYYWVTDCDKEFAAWQMIYPHLPVKTASHGDEKRLIMPYLGVGLNEVTVHSMEMNLQIQIGIVKSLKNLHDKGFAYDSLFPEDIMVDEHNNVHIVNLYKVHIKDGLTPEQREVFSKQGGLTRYGTVKSTIVKQGEFNYAHAADLNYLAWVLEKLNERSQHYADYSPLPPAIEQARSIFSLVLKNTHADWTVHFNKIFDELINELTKQLIELQNKKVTPVPEVKLGQASSSYKKVPTEEARGGVVPKKKGEDEGCGCLPRFLRIC